MSEIQKLKALAEAQPLKEWTHSEGDLSMMTGARMYYVSGPEGASDWENWGFTRRAASYIAAAKPAAVLELIAERDAYRAALEGAGYRMLDNMAERGPELARAIGSANATLVMGIQQERDTLKAENEESQSVIDSLAKVLAEIAVALKGEELPLHRHGYHDLPELVAVLKLENELRKAESEQFKAVAFDQEAGRQAMEGEIARLKAENERLRADYAALSTFNPEWDRVAAAQDSVREHMDLANQLKAENEVLRKDAERYRWLRFQHWSGNKIAVVLKPKQAVTIGHVCPSLDHLDAEIDAAMSKEAQS